MLAAYWPRTRQTDAARALAPLDHARLACGRHKCRWHSGPNTRSGHRTTADRVAPREVASLRPAGRAKEATIHSLKHVLKVTMLKGLPLSSLKDNGKTIMINRFSASAGKHRHILGMQPHKPCNDHASVVRTPERRPRRSPHIHRTCGQHSYFRAQQNLQ